MRKGRTYNHIIFEEFLTPEEINYIKNDCKITRKYKNSIGFLAFLKKFFKKLKNIIRKR